MDEFMRYMVLAGHQTDRNLTFCDTCQTVDLAPLTHDCSTKECVGKSAPNPARCCTVKLISFCCNKGSKFLIV